jgi:hypothetical protein
VAKREHHQIQRQLHGRVRDGRLIKQAICYYIVYAEEGPSKVGRARERPGERCGMCECAPPCQVEAASRWPWRCLQLASGMGLGGGKEEDGSRAVARRRGVGLV